MVMKLYKKYGKPNEVSDDQINAMIDLYCSIFVQEIAK